MKAKLVFSCLLLLVLTGCSGVQMGTKREAYPSMYTDKKPVTLVVVPAINESTAADAGDLLNVTVAQPFTNHGYYVLPVPIVADIFKREGIVEGTQVKGLPTNVFKKNFGADSVLFMTIENWDKKYLVLAGNVTIGIEYVLLSTESNEVLWSYEQQVVVDTSGSSGNILVDLVSTAISTAAAEYVPVAYRVHMTALETMPFGKYHPRSGSDGDMRTVNLEAKDAAVSQDD
jgi:hypothetical protein